MCEQHFYSTNKQQAVWKAVHHYYTVFREHIFAVADIRPVFVKNDTI